MCHSVYMMSLDVTINIAFYYFLNVKDVRDVSFVFLHTVSVICSDMHCIVCIVYMISVHVADRQKLIIGFLIHFIEEFTEY